MRASMLAIAMAIAVTGCGGGDSGGSTGTIPPTPTPSPTPSPPPPTYSYTKYAALTGDQNFRSACAVVALTGNPFQARFATPYGNGVPLDYNTATDTYRATVDGVPSTFAPGDRDPAAPAGALRYLKVVNGFTERFSIGQPTVAGTALEYVRGFGLTARAGTGQATQFSCIFGVPTVVGDAPAGSNIPFARVALNGAAYVNDAGAMLSYSLAGSTATLAANVVTGAITVTIQLVGIQQTASGPVGGNVAFGSYTGTGSIDTTAGSFTGSLVDTAPSPTVNGTFGGWFFGPQGAEGAAVLVMTGPQPGTGKLMTVTATIAAIRQ